MTRRLPTFQDLVFRTHPLARELDSAEVTLSAPPSIDQVLGERWKHLPEKREIAFKTAVQATMEWLGTDWRISVVSSRKVGDHRPFYGELRDTWDASTFEVMVWPRNPHGDGDEEGPIGWQAADEITELLGDIDRLAYPDLAPTPKPDHVLFTTKKRALDL